MAVAIGALADGLILSANLLDYNAVYSWMGWFKTSTISTASSQHCICNYGSGVDRDRLTISTDGHFRMGSVKNGSAEVLVAGTQLSADVWYHMCMVRTSSTTLLAYLNGVLDITVTFDISSRAAITNNEIGRLGSAPLGSNTTFAYLKAWTTNLSAAEVADEVNTARPQKGESIYGWWPVFPGTSERLTDYSGKGHGWTLEGSPSDVSAPPVSWGAGQKNAPYVAPASGPVIPVFMNQYRQRAA